MSGPERSYSFTVTSEPLLPDEQEVFAADLAALGLDREAFTVLNAMLTTGSVHSIPKVLRAYRDARLAGVAYFIECRRSGQTLFEGAAGTLMSVLGGPTFYWSRVGNLVDASANVGYVSGRESRDDFVDAALGELQRRYQSGSVIWPSALDPGRGYVGSRFCDSGVMRLDDGRDLEERLQSRKNLRRKVSKFRNKGGVVEVHHGALSPETRAEISRCIHSLRPLLLTPFQDIYPAMVDCAARIDSKRVVHFITRIDGEMVGYHSFAESPSALHALSGAFDRNRHSNYHAYENMILETVRYGLEQGKKRIEYGPVLNPTKADMMDTFEPTQVRMYSRLAPVRWTTPLILRMSRVNPVRFAQYIGIAAKQAET